MRRTRFRILTPGLAALGAVLAALAVTGPAPAQQPNQKKPVVPLWGTQAFTRLLHLQKLTPVQSIDDLANLPPEDTAIIVFGNPEPLDDIRNAVGNFKKFKDNGGAVLIATDWHYGGPALHDLGLFIPGIPVQVPGGYRGLDRCPLLHFSVPEHPIFKGLSRPVAANGPSEIRFQGNASGLRVLANPRSPELGLVIELHNIVGSRPDLPGRALIVAGHGVFMNIMWLPKDLDNAQFSRNCVDWLSNEGKRKYCLFVEEKKIHTRFDVAVSQVPPIPLPGEEKINQLLKIAENENIFNRFIVSTFGKERILQYVLLGLSLMLFTRLVFRLFNSRYAPDAGLPLVARTLEVTTSTQPLVEQRYQVLARRRDLGEIAADLARRWLEAHGITEKGEQAPHAAGPSRWSNRRWQRQLATLWRVAWGTPDRRIDPNRFRALVALMNQADAAIGKGELKLNPG